MKISGVFPLLLIAIELVSSKPLFYYGTPQTLTRIVASASSVASKPFTAPISYISDLRPNKIQKQENGDDLDNDDFFKESVELSENNPPTTTADMNNEATPNLLQKKINKILNKLRFISMLTTSTTTTNNNNGGANNEDSDDDFEKEQDEFNKEFEEDFLKKNHTKTTIRINNNKLEKQQQQLSPNGYFYSKPLLMKEHQQMAANRTNFGIFFMELLGSIVGLAYGAAAQFNQQQNGGAATLAPSPPF